MKKLAYAILAIAGSLYYATIGRLCWMTGSLSAHKRRKMVIPCPICGNADVHYRASAPIVRNLGFFDKRPFARKIYTLNFIRDGKLKTILKNWEKAAIWPGKAMIDYYQCAACDLYFQNTPIGPEARGEYYARFYRQTKKFGRPKNYFKPESRFHLWADFITEETRLEKGAKILDVGCGEGFLVHRLREKGYDAYGVEPSAPMVRYGTEDLKLPTLKNSDYSEETYPEGTFDLITSYHVAEHVNDITGFVKAAYNHLKPGGFFVTSTPCGDKGYEHYKFKLYPERFEHIYGGGHNVLYTLKYLSEVMEKNGFVVFKKHVVDSEDKLLSGRHLAPSGEKWLGMTLIAKK